MKLYHIVNLWDVPVGEACKIIFNRQLVDCIPIQHRQTLKKRWDWTQNKFTERRVFTTTVQYGSYNSSRCVVLNSDNRSVFIEETPPPASNADLSAAA
jgi:hypothetical protein